MNIGVAIKKIRLKKELRQKEFSEKIGISQTYLSQIEKGRKNPSLKTLKMIAEDSGIPLPALLWFGVELEDVEERKKDAYKIIKPSLDANINSLFFSGFENEN